MKESTVQTYFKQWKKTDMDFEQMYKYTQGLFNKASPDRDYNLEMFARILKIPKEELEAILSKPHGFRSLMTGKLYFPVNENADHNNRVALEVAMYISDYLNKRGGEFADVHYALDRWMKENRRYREAEEADIEEENEKIAFFRQVLEAADMAEQEGRPKHDRLSKEEQEKMISYGLEAKIQVTVRNAERQYWLHIGELMSEGLTKEQAREKMYKDLIDNGDLQGAQEMRLYQNIVHPLKVDNQDTPPSNPQ